MKDEELLNIIMRYKFPDNYPEDMFGGAEGQVGFGIALFSGVIVAGIIYLGFKFFTIL